MLRSVQRNYWIFRQLVAKLHLITYGCQMNEYDSERVAGLSKPTANRRPDTGPDLTPTLPTTCATRRKPEAKGSPRPGDLRPLNPRRPHVTPGVTGALA